MSMTSRGSRRRLLSGNELKERGRREAPLFFCSVRYRLVRFCAHLLAGPCLPKIEVSQRESTPYHERSFSNYRYHFRAYDPRHATRHCPSNFRRHPVSGWDITGDTRYSGRRHSTYQWAAAGNRCGCSACYSHCLWRHSRHHQSGTWRVFDHRAFRKARGNAC